MKRVEGIIGDRGLCNVGLWALGDKFESDNRIESQPYLQQLIQLLSHHEKVYNTHFRSSIFVEGGGFSEVLRIIFHFRGSWGVFRGRSGRPRVGT